jgi:hypothetical protein
MRVNRFPRRDLVYHLTLDAGNKGGKPIIISSIDKLCVPSFEDGAFILFLESLSDDKQHIQLNYAGTLKPFTLKVIEKLAREERESKRYRNLLEQYDFLREQADSLEPIQITENSDTLIGYRRKNREIDVDSISLITFGKRYPRGLSNSQLSVRCAGDYEFAKLSEFDISSEELKRRIRFWTFLLGNSLKNRYYYPSGSGNNRNGGQNDN